MNLTLLKIQWKSIVAKEIAQKLMTNLLKTSHTDLLPPVGSHTRALGRIVPRRTPTPAMCATPMVGDNSVSALHQASTFHRHRQPDSKLWSTRTSQKTMLLNTTGSNYNENNNLRSVMFNLPVAFRTANSSRPLGPYFIIIMNTLWQMIGNDSGIIAYMYPWILAFMYP